MLEMHDPAQVAQWLQASGVRQLHCDSRRLQPGDAFVAWPGAAQDGRRYVPAAFRAGAVACVVEREGSEALGLNAPRVLAVRGLKHSVGEIAHHFYRTPSTELPLLAITGTNGKTSTAWWTAQLLSALGQPCGLIGTLGMGQPGTELVPTGLTTPDPVMLQAALRGFVDQGLRACVLEASSIGLEEGRLNGARVHSAVFTNLTQDHLDYHHSMQAYWQAKQALFDWPGVRVAVVNIDDPHGAELAASLQPRVQAGALEVWTLSTEGRAARLRVPEWSMTDTGLRCTVVETLPDGTDSLAGVVELPLVGEYNLYNLLSAVALARGQGHSLARTLQACTALTPVPGRMQAAWPEALPDQASQLPLVLADYAHTPDALEKALHALQPLALQRGGHVWCVVGCGGDRDAGKRPLMAAVAERAAAHVVLTSDNPRTEPPLQILADMRAGLSDPNAARIEPDRARAIAQVVAQAAPADVVLLAGKGHENYQEVMGIQQPFSDLAQARAALQCRLLPTPKGSV